MASQKIDSLAEFIGRCGKLAIALSGGVDSSALLAFCAARFGGENFLALSARAPYIPRREMEYSRELCAKLGVEHVEIEMEIPNGVEKNPPDRCYICKRAMFSSLFSELASRGFQNLADGSNVDDLSDWRPGMRALKELGVLSPFIECGFSKGDIRLLAESLSLECADAPANSCLLTRLDFGRELEVQTLRKIEKLENFIKSLGFPLVRVRLTGDLARIEVSEDRLSDLSAGGRWEKVRLEAEKMGFRSEESPRAYKRSWKVTQNEIG